MGFIVRVRFLFFWEGVWRVSIEFVRSFGFLVREIGSFFEGVGWIFLFEVLRLMFGFCEVLDYVWDVCIFGRFRFLGFIVSLYFFVFVIDFRFVIFRLICLDGKCLG